MTKDMRSLIGEKIEAYARRVRDEAEQKRVALEEEARKRNEQDVLHKATHQAIVLLALETSEILNEDGLLANSACSNRADSDTDMVGPLIAQRILRVSSRSNRWVDYDDQTSETISYGIGLGRDGILRMQGFMPRVRLPAGIVALHVPAGAAEVVPEDSLKEERPQSEQPIVDKYRNHLAAVAASLIQKTPLPRPLEI